ncbi:hypothetical protein OBBRIDRAFT_768631 [Obba rivulosa]|uniref:FUN14 family protein n=1 Tax=Obba rivulosa TaxID=1052685 RepID=A0A8E2DSD3_9APHY|nr:hypothetical protein OBBRIDRAFT_768631 [Obba rivulosa]
MLVGHSPVLSRCVRPTCYSKTLQPWNQRILTKSFSSNSIYRFSSTISSRSLAGNITAFYRTAPSKAHAVPLLYKVAGVAGVGLGLSLFTSHALFCEPVVGKSAPFIVDPPAELHSSPNPPPPPPPPPASSVKYLELTFGTVCGICAGVFVKKGSKAVAFILGGAFVFLQYLGSLSLVRVDWSRAAQRFENLFYSRDATGVKRPPNVGSLMRWLTDFLTADFQQRASFIAGFALGLRIG